MIGGIRDKKMMFHYYQRSQLAWITAFSRMSKFNFVQRLLQFQFWKFGRISHKFLDKNEILEYITQKVSRPTIFVQNVWNFHQMTTPCRGTKLMEIFWKFSKLAILSQFCTKNWLNSGFCRPFLVQNWHKIANFQNFQKSSLKFVPLYGYLV